jgi:hypothetical protein|tara:strand:- start:2715 stop:3314 length:600 start_codon:yes stop_codon:yes gene_type:complete
MGILNDVKAITISDEVAADDDFIVTAARPNTSATIANSSFASGGARILNVTTTGTGDNGKTNTIVGTDVFGDALTEVITSTGSAEAVAGTKYFKTITSVTSSAQFAANLKVGSTASASQAIFGGRTRLQGMSIVSGGTAGVIQFYDGTPDSGTVLFKARTIGTDNTTEDYYLPAGILFASGMSVQYTIGTIDMMTFYYA